ncbi:MAG TPA: hypothetical protein PLA94_28480, partial [Myxococcota bacterium]|nr:hypothetical protein [Myxococcota bacterium]
AVGTTGSGKAAPADFFTIGASRLGIDPQNVVRVRAGVEVWRIQDPAVFVSQLPDVPVLTWKLLGSAGEGRVWLVPEVEGVAWVHQLHPAGMVLPPRQEVRIHPTGHQSSLRDAVAAVKPEQGWIYRRCRCRILKPEEAIPHVVVGSELVNGATRSA